MNGGRYREEKKIRGLRARVTYEGCDFVWRATAPKPGNLHNILTVSNAAYIRSGKQLFYINKAKNILIELPLNPQFDQEVNGEGRFHETNNPHGLALNQPKSLSAANLKWIQDTLGHTSPGSSEVRNIEFALSPKQRQALLRRLPDRRMDSKNAAYTYMFQASVAKYQADVIQELAEHHSHQRRLDTELNKLDAIDAGREKIREEINATQLKVNALKPMQSWMKHVHTLSTHFTRFESFINNPPDASPRESLKQLLQAIKTYQAKHSATMDFLIGQYADNPKIIALLTTLNDRLKTSTGIFRDNIKNMIKHDATSFQVKCLMSIQNLGGVDKSLGTFMAEQMTHVLEVSINVGYEINDNRLADLVHLSPAIAVLSDTKKLIEIKAFTLDGTEYNNTYSAIPSSMLDVLEGDDKLKRGPKQWFSIQPYIADWNPIDLDKTICLVTGDTLTNRKKPGFLAGFVKILASFLEAGLALAIRVPATIILSVVALLGAPTWASGVDLWLSRWHNRLSPVKATKRLWNTYYQRLDPEGNPVANNDPHQELLTSSMKASSFFHQLFVYLSPQRVADNIRLFVTTLLHDIVKIPQDLFYLGSSFFYKEKPEDVYQKIKWLYDLEKLYRVQLETAQKKKYDALNAKRNAGDLTDYAQLRYCDINEISSPLEVFREVMITLNDTIIDPMFRKSPGASTFFFMLAMTTFGTYLAPASALAWMKSAPAWLQIPTNMLSLHFTGKATSLGIQEQMIACFLEWKLGFFATELLIEIHHGNYEIFNDLFHEPEKLTMGLVGLIAMGASIQYLPLLPTSIVIRGLPPIYNYYAEILNIFIDEAKGCAGGTIPLTGLEYGFLGLKFAMLMHSMVSGSHAEQDTEAHQKLAQACSETQFLTKLLNACEYNKLLKEPNEPARNKNFQKILGHLLKETLRTQQLTHAFTTSELVAFRKALTEQVSPAIQQFLHNKTQEEIADAQNDLQDGEHPKNKLRKLLADNHPKTPPKIECSSEMALVEAHRALLEAIEMASDEKTSLIFANDRLKEANKFYDHLDQLFNNYNHQLQKRRRADLCIDKRDFLDLFYNKYCYQGSNNLLRSLIFFPIPLPFPPYVFPAYLLVVLFRETKRLCARWFNKPSIEHQVEKSYSKDVVLLYQFAAIIARTLYAINRSISYSLRAITAVVLFSIGFIPFILYQGFVAGANAAGGGEPVLSMTWKSFFNQIDTLCCMIALHRAFPIGFARPLYARAARAAGTIERLEEPGGHVLKQLQAAEGVLHTAIKRPNARYIESHSLAGQRLGLADREKVYKRSPIKQTKKRTTDVPKWPTKGGVNFFYPVDKPIPRKTRATPTPPRIDAH